MTDASCTFFGRNYTSFSYNSYFMKIYKPINYKGDKKSDFKTQTIATRKLKTQVTHTRAIVWSDISIVTGMKYAC